jgi:hypothetical protein
MLLGFLMVLVMPLALGAAAWAVRGRVGAQLALTLGAALVMALAVAVLELGPRGLAPGSTWVGYALIGLSPFVAVGSAVAAFGWLQLRKPALPHAALALAVPFIYWVALAVGVSAAVTLGLASP